MSASPPPAGAGLRLAVGTFTRYPSGEVTITPGTARAALLLAPVAALPLAFPVFLVGLTVELGVPPLVAAGVILAFLGHGSRGMHLDGLADTVDGLGAGWTRDRALTVLRSGDVGPMGVVALVLVLLVQAAATAALLGGWRGALLVAGAVLCSRAAAAAVSGTAMAAPGSRMGAAFVGRVPLGHLVLLALFAVALLFLAALPVLVASTSSGAWPTGRALVAAGLAVPLGLGAAVALRERAARTFGGVNGDVLGAGIEVALTVILVTLTLGGW